LLLLSLAAVPARADDLDLIPDSVLEAPPPAPAPPTDARSTLFLEWLPQATLWRTPLVALPPANRPDLGQRLGLDGRGQFDLGPEVTLTLSDRLNASQAEGRPAFDRDTLSNDWREGYLTWTAADGRYLDAGRINVRNGVAQGFNPTDVFKTRAVVTRTSDDPGALRENRLGTLMVRGQAVWAGGALALIGAPGLGETPDRWWSDRRTLGLGLERTNRLDRWLARGSMQLADDFAPELLFYREGGQNRLGANLTRGFGDRIVTYAEWSGGWRGSLVDEALGSLRRQGMLPPGAPSALPVSDAERFRQQLALGFSYAGDHKDSTNLEYHFNQAGLGDQDWQRWLAVGQAAGGRPEITGQLWQIRRYAQEMGEPLARHSLFMRSQWQDALMPELDLIGLADFDLQDHGLFAQAIAEYHLSPGWTLGLSVGGFFGAADSRSGSVPTAGSLTGKIRSYF
jgi:hypothetical protein